eukprot:m.157246 g.157246  ORF g.157246 m.157246 type:complete len:160 (+) comp15111_c0_seq7:313-792(+)
MFRSVRLCSLARCATVLAPSRQIIRNATPISTLITTTNCKSKDSETDNSFVIMRPTQERTETESEKRSRLLYQSRKRGIKENDLIMGTFAGKYLEGMTQSELAEYDSILNDHDNEWDMYAWMVGRKPLPDYLSDSQVMHKLVEHAENREREMRIDAPPL